jgi:KipI family sensor histidine kinase inhibitor
VAGFECREYGDAAVLVDVVADGYEARWAAAQALGDALRETGLDVLATYQHVFVAFDPRRLTHADIRAAVAKLEGTPAPPPRGNTLEIPVVYDGPDLQAVAEELSLTPDELVDLHRSQPWTVRFLGSPLAAPFCEGPRFPAPVRRMPTPRVRVPSGSVAISGQQTTIYLGPSPGGWRLIGRTSLELFRRDADPPVPYRPGDRLRFA